MSALVGLLGSPGATGALLTGGEAVGRVAPVVGGVLGLGGVAVAALPDRVRMRRELRRRWRTWALATPVFLGSLFFGEAGAAVLAAGLGLIAVNEFARMTPGGATERTTGAAAGAERHVLAVAAVVLPLLAWLRPQWLDLRVVAVLLIAAALPALLSGDHRSGTARTSRALFGLLWIPVALTGLVLLGGTAVAVGAAVALGDVGAWCGGTALGRRGALARPLSPLSPNKTWAGVLGSAVATAGALLAVGAFTPLLWVAVLAGCVLGDLLESMVKREAGVKDAGSWLPGFGGLLDRIDSLLVALLLAMVVTL
ncbi:phosphatidate cytidylyltransferase [Streptomyces sp. NPDC093589]|uniref:phosphatidate cytidylyltransferase n=1 Tax=Streptomyces sp. NPDC093589 TaxID=3366043 RepID=UPI003822CDB3